jgi:hypothetical protein
MFPLENNKHFENFRKHLDTLYRQMVYRNYNQNYRIHTSSLQQYCTDQAHLEEYSSRRLDTTPQKKKHYLLGKIKI